MFRSRLPVNRATKSGSMQDQIDVRNTSKMRRLNHSPHALYAPLVLCSYYDAPSYPTSLSQSKIGNSAEYSSNRSRITSHRKRFLDQRIGVLELTCQNVY
ncbi:hypothetical protein FRC03_000359 [Tulasnella sp. 419]|nr:hypothetical protein FRC03_000359 [Tulasnella sp. 419]